MSSARRFGGVGLRRGIRGVDDGAWTPGASAALNVWYRLGDPGALTLVGSDIDRAFDMGGSSDALAGSAPARPVLTSPLPILEQPGASFVRANSDFLDTSGVGAISIPQPFTVVMSVAFTTAPATLQEPCGDVATWWMDTFGGNLRIFGGAAAVDAGALAINTAYVIVAAFNGTTSRVRINGVSTYSAATNIGTSTATRILLGRGSSGAHLGGEMGEFQIYNGNLVTNGTGDLAKAEAYMAKYL